MATAKQLKALRKKYGLGEFSKKRRKKRPVRQPSYPPGYLGYPGRSVKEDFYRSIGVPEIGYEKKSKSSPARSAKGGFQDMQRLQREYFTGLHDLALDIAEGQQQ